MSLLADRIESINADFCAADASAAWLFCDRHDADAVAFTIVDGADVAEITYGRLAAESRALALGLRAQGIGPGDRVATLLRKGSELVTVMVATWRLGAVYVPLFTAFAAAAVEFRLRAAEAKVVVTDPVQRPKLGGVEANCRIVVVAGEPTSGELRYDDLLLAEAEGPDAPSYVQGGAGALVHIFTSGTTGSPKGVIQPLRYAAGWQAYLEFGMGVTRDSRYWCAADPGWAYGLYAGVVAPLAAGVGTILQVGAFDPAGTWSTIDRLGVTDFTAAPTVYRAMRRAHPGAGAGASLKRLSSAGEPLTPEVNAWSAPALGLTVHDHYGQTEVGMIFANHHHPDLARDVREGWMGQCLPGWSAVVLAEHDDRVLAGGEVGRIAIDTRESPFMTFTDYQDRRQSASRFTADRRYYLLGDLGSTDENGSFRFSSRDDDVIIMAGYRIGPFELESVISTHPSVAECAVVAAPDADRGEVVEAFVVRGSAPIADEDLAREIQVLVKTQYAAHAYPRAVHFVDTLPKTPSGKIQRFVLREQRRAAHAVGSAS